MHPGRPTASDQGESLIEIIVAVLILGLATVAIVGGLTLSAKASDIHRKEATASAAVRDYAEMVEKVVAGGGYATGATAYPAYTPPTGYTAAASKQCWTGSAWTACSAGTDIGVQQLTLSVASVDGRATEKLVIVVRYPCTQPTVAQPCP